MRVEWRSLDSHARPRDPRHSTHASSVDLARATGSDPRQKASSAPWDLPVTGRVAVAAEALTWEKHTLQRVAGSLELAPNRIVAAATDARYCGAPLESRWPLLDTRLLEFALAIPPIPWCQRKALFRRSFQAELPPEIINRPKTPLPDYYEKQIVRWRTSTHDARPVPLNRVQEFVDTSGIESIFRQGSTAQVLAGWRVLQLEQWLGSRHSS